MYLRKKGRRIVLLHSYRDGRQRVRQMRLGHLEQDQALDHLDDIAWRRDFELRNSDLKLDWDRLRAQAVALIDPDLAPLHRPERAERIEQILKTLLQLLNHEDDDKVLARVAEAVRLRRRCKRARFERAQECIEQGNFKAAESELKDLVAQTRAPLPARRRRFDPDDAQAAPYLKAQAMLSQVLREQGKDEECAWVQAKLTNCCPTREALRDMGAVLQRMGYPEAAMAQYERVARWDSWRHYNLASAAWQQDRKLDALTHLLRGMSRGVEVTEALEHLEAGRKPGRGADYWHRYGSLWNQRARQFFLAVSREMLVRVRLRQAAERRVQVRDLVKGKYLFLLYERVCGPPLQMTYYQPPPVDPLPPE